jgi:hypothetical protein
MLFSSIAYYTYLPLAANCEIALALLFASHHHSVLWGCVINIIGVEYFTRLSLSKLVVCASRALDGVWAWWCACRRRLSVNADDPASQPSRRRYFYIHKREGASWRMNGRYLVMAHGRHFSFFSTGLVGGWVREFHALLLYGSRDSQSAGAPNIHGDYTV